MSSIAYRSEIDGLRAAAVLGVVVFHFRPEWLPGGFVGVDVFFVISGFLIGSIVLAELEAGSFSLANFWARRIRRILPALLFMTVTALVAGRWLLFPADFTLLANQAFGALAMNANHVVLRLSNGYWGHAAESLPLLHTWSLGVEEQFYAAFPFVALWMYARFSIRAINWVVVSVILASYLACVLLTQIRPSWAFYLLPTRAWEIGAGVLTSILVRRYPAPRLAWAPILSLAGIIACFFLVRGDDSFPGWIAVLPVLLTSLFVYSSGSQAFGLGLLTNRLSVYIGKLSYSLYLWHWPAIFFASSFFVGDDLAGSRTAWALVGCLAGTLASYHVIEKAGKSLRRPYLFAIVSIASAVVLSFGLKASRATVEIPAGYVSTWSGSAYDALEDSKDSPEKKRAGVHFRELQPSGKRDQGIARLVEPPGFRGNALVIGDSHGIALGSVLEKALVENGFRAVFMTGNGALPGIGMSVRPKEQFAGKSLADMQLAAAAREKFDLLIVVARYENTSRKNADSILEYVRKVCRTGDIPRVLFIQQPPVLPFGDVSAPEWFAWSDQKHGRRTMLRPVSSDGVLAGIAYYEQNALRIPGADLLPTRSRFLDEQGHVVYGDGKSIYYFDDDHLSDEGAALIGPDLSRRLAAYR